MTFQLTTLGNVAFEFECTGLVWTKIPNIIAKLERHSKMGSRRGIGSLKRGTSVICSLAWNNIISPWLLCSGRFRHYHGIIIVLCVCVYFVCVRVWKVFLFSAYVVKCVYFIKWSWCINLEDAYVCVFAGDNISPYCATSKLLENVRYRR